jgi:hypothetical protein
MCMQSASRDAAHRTVKLISRYFPFRTVYFSHASPYRSHIVSLQFYIHSDMILGKTQKIEEEASSTVMEGKRLVPARRRCREADKSTCPTGLTCMPCPATWTADKTLSVFQRPTWCREKWYLHCLARVVHCLAVQVLPCSALNGAPWCSKPDCIAFAGK